MTRCTQPGCSGTIVDGYCDVCGMAAQSSPVVPGATAAPAGSAPAGGAAGGTAASGGGVTGVSTVT
ncbi:hypothetical protein, partial [Intrasporangium chromatireducens]|uniref:hypothetical protein n=1 Tax=Intrasporangium chromatireducens TaxID=1386088 RepID=UPI001969E104